MLLKGEKIFLRTPVVPDAQCICRWENDPQLSHVNCHNAALSLQDVTDWIARRNHDLLLENELRLMICSSAGEVLGCIDLFEYDSYSASAGVGIVVEESRRRKGVGSEALSLLSQHCFGPLKFQSLWCNIPASNIPSIALFSRCGFEQRSAAGHAQQQALPSPETLFFCRTNR